MNEDFKINVNKFTSSEAIINIIKIEHDKLSTPICLCDDNLEITVGNDTYSPFPFKLKKADDVQGELPQVVLTIPNIGLQLLSWIDTTMGAKNARFQFMITRRSTKAVETKITLKVASVSINSETITFRLNIQNNLHNKAIRWTYDNEVAMGLF